MAKVEDYYSILQVSPHAPIKDIKAAFRRLARLYHPDLNPNDSEAVEKFKHISQAYETLSDSNKRRRYDRELKYKSTHRSTQYSPKSQSTSKTAQDFYNRGLEKSQQKDFQGAIEHYTRAIELDQTFIDAYLKRCEMRYKLGENKGVLEDCYQVLKIDPQVAKAYYYQGRARYRLGYGQSAIDSYTQAIRQDKNYAQAYYYRALAYREQKDTIPALEDLQTAAKLFHNQGNFSAHRLTKKTIQELTPGIWQLGQLANWLNRLWQNSALVLLTYLFNPGGGLLPAFSSLEKQEALEVGIIYGIITDLIFVFCTNLYQQKENFSLLALCLVGIIPFMSLIIASHLIRFFFNRSGGIDADTFIAGTTLIPLGVTTLIVGFICLFFDIPFSVDMIMVFLPFIIFGCSYTIITLYVSCTQILNLTEARAAFVIPLMLLTGIFLSYIAFIPILG